MNKLAMANCLLLVFVFLFVGNVLGVFFWTIIYTLILIIDKKENK